MASQTPTAAKRAARAYMAEHGVRYSAALRIVQAQHAAESAREILAMPQARSGRPTPRARRAQQRLDQELSREERILAGAMLGLLNELVDTPLIAQDLALPPAAPPLGDCLIMKVKVNPERLEIEQDESESILYLPGSVLLAGELDIDEAHAGEERGRVVISGRPNQGRATVALTDWFRVEVSASLRPGSGDAADVSIWLDWA